MAATAGDVGSAAAVGARFVAALARQDWAELESCFAADVAFRALIPRGLREARDSASAAGYLRQWFGDATELHLAASDVPPVQDRLGISYRFRAREDKWYIVEQQAYCDVAEGHVTRMDVLCSGFRPEGQP